MWGKVITKLSYKFHSDSVTKTKIFLSKSINLFLKPWIYQMYSHFSSLAPKHIYVETTFPVRPYGIVRIGNLLLSE